MTQRVWPYLLYPDVEAAAAWLERAFGFRVVERTTGAAGGAHLELELDAHGTRVFAGQPSGAGYRGPAEAGRTAMVYVLLDGGLDEHCERARAAGGEIVEEPNDTAYGQRRYGCRDPQGHEWTFGAPLEGA